MKIEATDGGRKGAHKHEFRGQWPPCARFKDVVTGTSCPC